MLICHIDCDCAKDVRHWNQDKLRVAVVFESRREGWDQAGDVKDIVE
jgi:hypothetical protein